MSKAALRKELAAFDAEQLRELVLNVYDASKEAKAYLEFFLNPDAEALLQKKVEEINKELRRTKRGSYSKARVSVIRKSIKEVESYGVGYSYVAKLMSTAIQLYMVNEKFVYYTATQENGLKRLVRDYLSLCTAHGEGLTAFETVKRYADDPRLCTDHMHRLMTGFVNSALEELRTPLG